MKKNHLDGHPNWLPFFALVCLSLLSLVQSSFAQTTLWRVGLEDNSRAEFPASQAGAPPANYSVPTDWATRTSFPEWSGVSNGNWSSNRNFDTAITYNLSSVPSNGAEFQFKTLNASQFVPQLAVFSNGKLAGIINMMGTRYFNPPTQGSVILFGDLFRVYIPKEFLQSGANTLRLKKLEHPYSVGSASVIGGANHPYLSFEYDYCKMVSLSSPASEPIHGRYINLSAESQTSSTSGSFSVKDAEVANRPEALKWLGVAYSGNMDRATFWRDVTSQQPRRLEYLQMLHDMNMQVIMDFYSRSRDPQQTANSSEWTVDANGVLLSAPRTALTNFFNQYGSLFQYYELSNEPTMSFSNESLPAQKAIADFLNTIRPAHIKITAPGYNYAFQNFGNPAGWDGNNQDLLRRDLETRTQATNGHSYNDSYRQSFAETLDTYKNQFPNGFTNGLPKEFVNTEFGASDGMNSAFDDSGLTEVHAQTFDRIVRAHLAFGSKFSVYGAGDANGSFQLFDGISPSAWTAHVNSNAPSETLRLKIFRQYALAYATHGKPLPFTFLNPSAITDKLAYVRAVDTSKLAALPGSGGTSNKILINFVNFDKVAQTVAVRVTLPTSGIYVGERFGSESSFSAARTMVSLTATPTVDLTVNLGPRESVQYILTPPAVAGQLQPQPGQLITLTADNGKTVVADYLGTRQLAAIATAPSAWDMFEVVSSGTSISLLARENDRFVCAESSGNQPLVANRSSAGNWEKFAFEPMSGGVVLRADINQRYVVRNSNQQLIASSTTKSGATVFQWEVVEDWTPQDIGSTGLAGSATIAGNLYTVRGAGADIWNNSDAFHFVHRPLNGDAVFTARVDSVQNTSNWAKVGVMIRESLAANSKHAMMIVTPDGKVSFQRRTTVAGVSTADTASGLSAPRWVRVVRTGNNFTAFHSSNGTSWTQLGAAVSIPMPAQVYMGLAVSSHSASTLCETVFSNVE